MNAFQTGQQNMLICGRIVSHDI